jgi:hypothetical protein
MEEVIGSIPILDSDYRMLGVQVFRPQPALLKDSCDHHREPQYARDGDCGLVQIPVTNPGRVPIVLIRPPAADHAARSNGERRKCNQDRIVPVSDSALTSGSSCRVLVVDSLDCRRYRGPTPAT